MIQFFEAFSDWSCLKYLFLCPLPSISTYHPQASLWSISSKAELGSSLESFLVGFFICLLNTITLYNYLSQQGKVPNSICKSSSVLDIRFRRGSIFNWKINHEISLDSNSIRIYFSLICKNSSLEKKLFNPIRYFQ